MADSLSGDDCNNDFGVLRSIFDPSFNAYDPYQQAAIDLSSFLTTSSAVPTSGFGNHSLDWLYKLTLEQQPAYNSINDACSDLSAFAPAVTVPQEWNGYPSWLPIEEAPPTAPYTVRFNDSDHTSS